MILINSSEKLDFQGQLVETQTLDCITDAQQNLVNQKYPVPESNSILSYIVVGIIMVIALKIKNRKVCK